MTTSTDSGKGSKDPDPEEVVRVRFTVTEVEDALIDKLAAASHGGNRSAFVREVVREKAQRREEDSLRVEIQRLLEQISEFRAELDQGHSSAQPTPQKTPETDTHKASSSSPHADSDDGENSEFSPTRMGLFRWRA